MLLGWPTFNFWLKACLYSFHYTYVKDEYHNNVASIVPRVNPTKTAAIPTGTDSVRAMHVSGQLN